MCVRVVCACVFAVCCVMCVCVLCAVCCVLCVLYVFVCCVCAMCARPVAMGIFAVYVRVISRARFLIRAS